MSKQSRSPVDERATREHEIGSVSIGGSGDNRANADAYKRRRPAHVISNIGWYALVAGVLFLVLYPMGWLAYGAVHDSAGNFSTEELFSMFGRTRTYKALLNTVTLGVLSTGLGALWAIPMAWFVTRTNAPFRRLFTIMPILTYVTPPFLLAFGYIFAAGPNGGYINDLLKSLGLPTINIFSMTGLVVATAAHTYVFIFLAATSAMSRLDAEYEEAAQMHGASRIKAVFTISLRLATPGILSGVLLAFIMSQNIFGTHAIIGIPAKIPLLTTEIYSLFSYPVRYTQAAGVSWLLFAVAGIAMLLNRWVLGAGSYVSIRGKGVRPSRLELNSLWRKISGLYGLIVILVSFIIPTGLIMITSFLRVWGDGLKVNNVSLQWYAYIFRNSDVRESVKNSLLLAVIAATVMVVIGVLVAYLILRTKVRGRELVRYVSLLPMTIPGIVLAVALIWGYSSAPFALYGTMAIIGIAYITKFYPVALNLLITSLEQIDIELEESGRTHGGTWWSVFSKVVVPLMKPGIVSAWVMAFVLSFNELAASVLLYSPGKNVVSVTMFRFWEEGRMEALAAFATGVIGLIALAYLIIRRVAGDDALTS